MNAKLTFEQVVIVAGMLVREMLHAGVLAAMLGMVLMCVGLPTVASRFLGHDPAQLRESLVTYTQVTLGLGGVLLLLAAAGTTEREVKNRTLCAVMVHPLGRMTYLTGRAAGVFALFALLVTVTLAAVGTASLTTGSGIGDGLWKSVARSTLDAAVLALVLVPLGALTSPVLATLFIALAKALSFFCTFVPATIHPAVGVLHKIVFFGSPVDVSSAAGWRLVLATVDCLLYGAVFMVVGGLMYRRRDLRVRA